MSDVLIFQHALLIDGTGAPPQDDVTVVVADGLIREVGVKAKLPAGRTINLSGMTLMPGLIDAHVHVGNIEIRNHLTAQLPPAAYVLRTCQTLPPMWISASPPCAMRPASIPGFGWRLRKASREAPV